MDYRFTEDGRTEQQNSLDRSDIAATGGLVVPLSALMHMPRWRFRPYNLVPFSVAFIASGNENITYLVLGVVAIFVYSGLQDFINIAADREEDAVNRPNRVVLAHKAGGYPVVVSAGLICLAVFTLLVAAMVVWGDLPAMWVLLWASGPVFVFAYSYGPRAKSSTYGSPLSHAFIPSLPLVAGWVGSAPLADILPYFVILSLIRLSNAALGFKDVDDVAGDARIGYRSIHSRITENPLAGWLGWIVILTPFAAITAFGMAGQVGEAWPVPLVMLAFAWPVKRIILGARTVPEGRAAREVGNFYQLSFIPLAVFVLEPEWHTLLIGVAGLIWYTCFTLVWHLDPGELSKENVSAAINLVRTGHSTFGSEAMAPTGAADPQDGERDSSVRYRWQQRVYSAKVPESAAVAAVAAGVEWDLAGFAGHKCCLVITYRRDGSPVPTPVWFATSGNRLVFLTATSAGKLKRVRRDGHVRVAPCTFRGRPTGPPMDGLACVLDVTEAKEAERRLRQHHGLGRRAYYRTVGPREKVYLEVVPIPSAQS